MRRFKIYGEMCLNIGNDYKITLHINDRDDNKIYEEISDGAFPLIECNYRFYDKIEGSMYERNVTTKFYRDCILEEIRKFAKWKLGKLRKDRNNEYNPVLLALAGKRTFDAMINETYGSCIEQTGKIILEMTASNGKAVSCIYNHIQEIILSGAQMISIDGGDSICLLDNTTIDRNGEKKGSYIARGNLLGKLLFWMLNPIQSVSDLLDVMEECAVWEEKGWFK